jgi:hypothetical protein
MSSYERTGWRDKELAEWRHRLQDAHISTGRGNFSTGHLSPAFSLDDSIIAT